MISTILEAIFGNKHEREVKRLKPIVQKINETQEKLKELTDDELRQSTQKIKKDIENNLLPIRNKKDEILQNLQIGYNLKPEEIKELTTQLKKLEDEELKILKKVLDSKMIDVYAIVKETMRRFATQEYLIVKATDFDKMISVKKKNVVIENDYAKWYSTWDVRNHPMKWDMIPFDVQLMGAIVLHEGKIAEMATGEGKTLVAVMPLFLNALSGKGVHLVTVNDYLAKRDCEWMGPIYEFHMLSCDCIEYWQPHSQERKKAYLADITYGTSSEFGFDYLRDNMATDINEVVQRTHYYAIIDEVDSILIDDARTPLIISGPAPQSMHHLYEQFNPLIARLFDVQKKEVIKFLNEASKKYEQLQKTSDNKEKKKLSDEIGTALLKCHRGYPKFRQLIKLLQDPDVNRIFKETEEYYLRDNEKEMPKIDKDLYFVIDERHRTADLTDKGIEFLESISNMKGFFVLEDVGSILSEIENIPTTLEEKIKKKQEFLEKYREKASVMHVIQQLLKAYALYEKDIDYVVINGEIKIVDENTGRILEGRRYSEGLHEAIECKENVPVGRATQTYATITLQNYFRMYHKLAGMTGTAETEAAEFWEIYKMDVVVIPTNKPCIRVDEPDIVFKTKKDKYKALIEKVEELHKQGRPVLLGTASIETSEVISRMLRMKNLPHQVLNAKYHEKEAEIIAKAGMKGAITVATNMAGRGTDIKLGPGVAELGGLAVIGSEKHEARRIDRQLRGRAGRQGDPGSSIFFISLEDDLMRLYGADKQIKILEKFGDWKDDSGIQSNFLSKIIEYAQKKVEQNNFGIRKRNLEFDDVLNKQRTEIYNRRRNALTGIRISLDILEYIETEIKTLFSEYSIRNNLKEIELDFFSIFNMPLPLSEKEILKKTPKEVINIVYNSVCSEYNNKVKKNIINSSLPILEAIWTKGNPPQGVIIPFALPKGILNLPVNLENAIKSGGQEIIRQLEKFVTIITIDEYWKEHLRALDNLRYESYQAVFEQKDPLLVYKIEATNLFKELIRKINREIISSLMRARVMSKEETEEFMRQHKALERKIKQENVKEYKPEPTSPINLQENGTPTKVISQVSTIRRSSPKIGRNDPCPCGSGKKYKYCHGK